MRKLTALFSVIVLMVGILALPITSYAYWNHGKVRIVSRGEDLKVRIVERGEDAKVRFVYHWGADLHMDGGKLSPCVKVN